MIKQTFSLDCKTEIIKTLAEKKSCCVSAFLYGVICFAKRFSRSEIAFTYKNELIARSIFDVLVSCGVPDEDITFERTGTDFNLSITSDTSIDRILCDYYYTGEEANFRLNTDNLICGECAFSFLAGCFVAGGTITDPSVNYHIAFITNKTLFSRDLCEFLTEKGYPPRISRRYYSKIIYYKDSESIEDLLTAMGAGNCAMRLMEQKIIRDIRNTVNRQNNCFMANSDKTIAASTETCAEVGYLFDNGFEVRLGDELREIAMLRMDNPELSLAQLGEMCTPPLSKSGVNHRIQKIIAIAREMREKHE